MQARTKRIAKRTAIGAAGLAGLAGLGMGAKYAIPRMLIARHIGRISRKAGKRAAKGIVTSAKKVYRTRTGVKLA